MNERGEEGNKCGETREGDERSAMTQIYMVIPKILLERPECIK